MLRKFPICLFLFLLSLATAANSSPLVTNVSGSVVDGNLISITGSGFGSTGPDIVIYDSFNRGILGNALSVNADIGAWTEMKAVAFYDPHLSHNRGARCFRNGSWLGANLKVFSQGYSNVYITSRAMVPSGYYFPGASSPETLPTISSLKHHWFYFGSTGYAANNDPDIFSVNWTGSTWYRVTSNDNCRATFDRNAGVQWVWGEPVRWSLWIKGNGISATGSNGLFQAVSSSGQILVSYKDYKAWFCADDNEELFDRVTVPGFLLGSGDTNGNYVIDDVYIAVGNASVAHVDIGDNSTYSSCHKLAITPTTNWSDTSITAEVHVSGYFSCGDQCYLFVVDSNGDVSSGYPVTIDCGHIQGTSISGGISFH